MNRGTMPTEAQYEKLATHLLDVIMHGDFMTSLTPILWIHTFHLMFDAAIDCGMDFEEVDPKAWATRTFNAWSIGMRL